MAARIGSVYLVLNGLLFLGLGIAYLAAPAKMAGKTDFVLSTDVATVEIRAIYGGMEIAIGILLCICLLRPDWLVPGLVLTVVLYAGFVGGRIVGMIAAAEVGGITWKLLAFAVIDLAAGVVLLISALRGGKAA